MTRIDSGTGWTGLHDSYDDSEFVENHGADLG